MITLPRSCVPCEKIEEDGYDTQDKNQNGKTVKNEHVRKIDKENANKN